MSYHGATSRQEAAEEALGRVLHALREAEPSPQLEWKLVSAVERRLSASPDPLSGWSRFRNPVLLAATGVALAGALFFAPVLRRGFQQREAPHATTFSEAVNGVLPSQTSLHKGDLHHDASGHPTRLQPQLGSAPLSGAVGSVVHPSTVSGKQVSAATWDHLASSELAAVEAAAPSQPEPALPLTSDEREIRRFVERHNAYELAALDPRAEPAHERAEVDQFQRFFAPPPEPSGNLPLPPPLEPVATPTAVEQR